MDFKDKRVLVVGLARSGLAAVRVLRALGANVIANDIKSREELKEVIEELDPIGVQWALGVTPMDYLDKVDLVVISPGIPIDDPFVRNARDMGIEVIGEVELAYRLCRAPIVAITGTNGKTTTTALAGEILTATGKRTYVVGNIGIPFVGIATEASESQIVVAEISSFQLESIHAFHPKVSAILNITEDHLNRHRTMENYIGLKAGVFKNATESDWLILNADDPLSLKFAEMTRAQTLFFSRTKSLGRGAWLEDNVIVLDIGDGREKVCKVDDIFIPGPHNLENAMAAVLLSRVMGVDTRTMAKVLNVFPGVEHRIELVKTLGGVTFYNDSKGTNIDSTLKAIESMMSPTVLIAGGYDKGSSFDGLIEAFGDTISHLVVLGQTSDKIMQSAKDKGFQNVYRVNTLEEGVKKAYSLALPGENILLSPACASWDMFKDFEERGRIFKESVRVLEEGNR